MAVCPECDNNVRTIHLKSGAETVCRHCGAKLVLHGTYPNARLEVAKGGGT